MKQTLGIVFQFLKAGNDIDEVIGIFECTGQHNLTFIRMAADCSSKTPIAMLISLWECVAGCCAGNIFRALNFLFQAKSNKKKWFDIRSGYCLNEFEQLSNSLNYPS